MSAQEDTMKSRRAAVTATATAVLAGLVLAVAGCSSSDADGGTQTPTAATTTAATTTAATTAAGVRHLSVQEFADAVAKGGVTVLDVRTPSEFGQEHLADAKNIDVQASTFTEQIAGLDKSASYLIYCRTGVRSANAAGRMLSAGFTNVVDLAGGITAWKAANKPVVTS